MINIVRAEYLKTRKSMGRRLIWAFPMIVFALAFVLTSGMTNVYAESVWNWWYTLLLPGMLAITCYLSIMREKKTGYYHLLTLSVSKRKLMMGKIIYMGCVLLASDMIIFAGASLGGLLLTTCVPFGGAAIAVLVLTISHLWEIPLLLFLSERFGMIVELLVCLFLTVGGIILAPTGKWYFIVSAIPMRILCPFLHILPNGIRAEAGNPLLDMGVVLPGICLSIIWFIVAAFLFLNWFDKREGK
ncbi:MAG: lantibiotic immunity ABC transporter MutE/EpiE family permease subunit [Candidatus Choladocola sp.]|nr:lantibiotic immunity ABC transporter MutE/EpiE family permease subunit [Candidatus Choladocola sp.]